LEVYAIENQTMQKRLPRWKQDEEFTEDTKLYPTPLEKCTSAVLFLTDIPVLVGFYLYMNLPTNRFLVSEYKF